MSDHDGVEQVITMAWRAHRQPSEPSPCEARMFFRQKRTLDAFRFKIPRDELRRRSRILVIDDECPELIDDLRRASFAVDYQADINKQNLSVLDQPVYDLIPVSYTHLRAHETGRNLVCRLLLEKKKQKK